MSGARMTSNRWALMAAGARLVVDDVVETYAGLMEASGAVAAPYEFGVLSESVQVEGARAGASLARRRIVVGAYYGLYQHEGTDRGIEGDPFLKDAVEYWRADYLAAVALVIGKAGI